jgi:SAM-dependent methyltransferase
MTTLASPPLSAAAAAYDELAEVYDTFTSGYAHDRWLAEIERLALAHGLRGRRLLDLACGTGKSFLPLRSRGFATTACDISPRMVEIARRAAPDVPITVADMRALDRLGCFDLITCLDDAVNYLLEEDDLAGFCASLARNLAPGGIAVFDVNSLGLYRTDFARDWLVDAPSAFVAWAGSADSEMARGDRTEVTIHVFTAGDDGWRRRESRHQQRHWTIEALDAAARGAGMRTVAVYGQCRGARLDDDFDELRHTKALVLVTHDERR